MTIDPIHIDDFNFCGASNLFKVDMKPLIRFGFQCEDEAGCFFIKKEKKLAVVFNLDEKSDKRTKKKLNAVTTQLTMLERRDT